MLSNTVAELRANHLSNEKRRIMDSDRKAINPKRICKYCGWDMDEPDLEILYFFHEDCWKDYRKDGLLYPMPKYD
jgi:hypothetical protein